MFQGRINKTALLVGFIMFGLLWSNAALAGPAITGQQLDKIVIDRTTKAQVISMFGQPDKTETVGDEEVLYYQTMKKDPLTGSDLCNVLTVTIGKKGKVQNLLFKRYCQR